MGVWANHGGEQGWGARGRGEACDSARGTRCEMRMAQEMGRRASARFACAAVVVALECTGSGSIAARVRQRNADGRDEGKRGSLCVCGMSCVQRDGTRAPAASRWRTWRGAPAIESRPLRARGELRARDDTGEDARCGGSPVVRPPATRWRICMYAVVRGSRACSVDLDAVSDAVLCVYLGARKCD